MRKSKSFMLVLILMSILLIGCRSNYHTGANTVDTKEQTPDALSTTRL